jgi:NAD(P)-dependent dehydrogenase (short-subunit alcohol dehydrogenase family)
MHTIDLTGKVALVTGGSRGLGRAMSLGLARAGARVVVASRKLANCERVCDEIRASGGQAVPCAVHLGDTASIDQMLEGAWNAFGGIDILVNNAGINPAFGALSEMSPELFQKIFDVNLRGPWYLASRLAPRMGQAGGGVVINVISVSALKPSAWMGFYAATKAGLNALTRVMAEEWAPLGIRVNSLAPGSYHSDLFDTAAAAVPGWEANAAAAALQNRVAETEEIIGPVLFLASGMSTYMTGTTLVTDGGYLVR